jgi:ribosomal protein S18 acetylase RimI-like enzyme
MVDRKVRVERIADEGGRRAALEVLRATYQAEKKWVTDPEQQIRCGDIGRADVAWFVVHFEGRAVGVPRVIYDPPIVQQAKRGYKLLGPRRDVEKYLKQSLIAEIGRFAVLAEHRSNLMLAAALMRAAFEDMVSRGYTHIITDVFEDDPHSPFGFHTRVMGFMPIATHDRGELNCSSRRITLVLDLKSGYQRLRARSKWLFRYLTRHWDDALHHRFAG